MKNVCIEAFTHDDKQEVLRLLSEAGLPTKDLTAEKLNDFLIARQGDGSVIGVVGVEQYGDVGLLRSLVVHPSHRGSGLGSRLTHELESRAHARGITTLYLLTMTAADYFPRLGYRVAQRAAVPASIVMTEEFKNICPISAVCLRRDL